MVLTGSLVVVSLGATALTDTQGQSALERAESAMTLFKSRASTVALGDSPSQRVAFGRDEGQFTSTNESGWLRVTHRNNTGTGDNETVLNRSLGAVVYANGDTKLAYQAGGVWRSDDDGRSRMVSPPEFHYRGATLTVPLIRVTNTDGGAGGATARITSAGPTRRVFPNATTGYENPVTNGTVTATIESRYYRGWADYLRQRTDGNVTVDPDRERVQVELVSSGFGVGAFEMPQEGNSLDVRGFGENHPIDTYELTLAADSGGAGDGSGNAFNNMHWSFFADEGSEQFEIHFYSDGGCSGGTYSSDLDVSIYYHDDSEMGGAESEEWQNGSVDVGGNDDFAVDCDAEELTVDLLSDTRLTYGDINLTGSDNKWQFGAEIRDENVLSPTATFGAHDADADRGNYTVGESQTLGFLTNHYLERLGPDFSLEVTDGPGGSSRVDETASTGTLTYDTSGDSGRYLTYLHVTDNRIRVTFD